MSIHLHSLNAAVVKNTCKILQNLSSNQTSSITECHRRAWRVPNTPPVYFWWRMMDLPSSKPSSVHSRGPPGQSSAQTPERAWLGNSFLFLFYFVLRKKTQTVRPAPRGFRARPQRAPPEVKWRAEAWGAPSSHSSSARTEHNEEPKPRSRNIATAAWALGTRKWSERTKEKKKKSNKKPKARKAESSALPRPQLPAVTAPPPGSPSPRRARPVTRLFLPVPPLPPPAGGRAQEGAGGSAQGGSRRTRWPLLQRRRRGQQRGGGRRRRGEPGAGGCRRRRPLRPPPCAAAEGAGGRCREPGPCGECGVLLPSPRRGAGRRGAGPALGCRWGREGRARVPRGAAEGRARLSGPRRRPPR